ncbi:hypothetical protein NQ317_010708 [Molorchus minor]|uniref:Epidermal cell surface receptor n=1 Tax=Molorchus minor TaxID=1323400 RepID=A0ABQ9K6B2_9CUCU|nr:hypothetical protein NQ317_010708 [Molorchus minor]
MCWYQSMTTFSLSVQKKLLVVQGLILNIDKDQKRLQRSQPVESCRRSLQGVSIKKVERPTTQEMLTHTAKILETTNVSETTETTDRMKTEEVTTQLTTETPETVTSPASLNRIEEELTENDISPTAIPSIIPLNPTENNVTSTTEKSFVNDSKETINGSNTVVADTDKSKETTEHSSTVSPGADEVKEETDSPSTMSAVTEEARKEINKSLLSAVVADESTEKVEPSSTFIITTEDSKETENSLEILAVSDGPMTKTERSSTSSATTENSEKKLEDSSTVLVDTDESKEKTEQPLSAVPGIPDESTEKTETSIKHAVTTEDRKGGERVTTSRVENELNKTSESAKWSDITVLPAADEPKGRALNFSTEEEDPNNVISSHSSNGHDNVNDDLDEATENDDDSDDYDMHIVRTKILNPKLQPHNSTYGICEKGGLTYENGEKLEVGCESVCTCRNGKMDCIDRCATPFFRKGKKIDDPLCMAKDTADNCCSILVCHGDTETEPLEMCTFENKTYNRGDKFNKECTEVCTCEAAGRVTCKPRCPHITKTSERCVEVPDPEDPCCKKVLCDVTLDEHDTDKEEEKPKPKILAARFINTTTIFLNFDLTFDHNESLPDVEVSNDKGNWTYYRMLPNGYVFVKDPVKYIKLENSDDIIDIEDLEMGPFPTSGISDNTFKDCQYKGKTFKIGEEYNDNCESLCICLNGQMKCLKIQCPTYFGVDVLDPNCIEWETIPPNFVPSPPNCCPEKVRCKENGSCDYEGRTYKNWEELPSNMGKVECQNICPPVTALPPPNLPCPPHLATLSHTQDDCCKDWVCNTDNVPASKHTQTSSNKGQTRKKTTDKYEVPFVPKAPSKALGPLAVYANEDNDHNIANNSLGIIHKSRVNPIENPFYHKGPRLPPRPKPDSNSAKNPFLTYGDPVAPFAPKVTQNKPPHKNVSLFGTPPIQHNQKENYIPHNYVQQNPPFSNIHQTPPTRSEINIHTQSNPEEVLQFIHQHPEISSYPSGSILEVHNIPSGLGQQVPLNNHASPIVHPTYSQKVPYIAPQNSEGNHVTNSLPPGLSLEHILAELNKNTHTQPFQNNNPPYHPQPHIAGSNGSPPQLSPHTIRNRHNTSFHQDTTGPSFNGNFPGFPNQPAQDEITIQSLDAIDPHTVRLSFTVPPIIVGLHGRVEVRYTDDKPDNDPDSWMMTVFAPPNDLIATPSLAFDLMELKADTEYKIKNHCNPAGPPKYTNDTPKEVHPPVIPINPDLAITDINATWVTVTWRQFTAYELSFIDGLQLRYKEIDGRIYTATPLIHRAETSYTLEKLKPNNKYEIGIYFIPFPGQTTELRSENILHFTTANEIDTYGFNVSLEISQIKSQSVEISWNGVPYPEDKYVNIYRVIYQSESGKEDQSTFKIAKRDSPTKTVIKDLKPGTRYRIWLEVYLTNGKTKTSNVEDFITKPRVAPPLGVSTQQDKLSRAEVIESKGDYYGPLVIVAILAAIAILSTLILLLILVRRHNQNKAAITPPSTRISQSAYDNPTYKVEIQQETMGL